MQLLLGGEDDDTEATKAFESSPLFAIDPATSTPPSSRRSTARPVSSSCGAEVWRSTYNNAELSLNDDAQGLALGPGFAVAAGSEQVLGEGYNVWVRAFYVP